MHFFSWAFFMKNWDTKLKNNYQGRTWNQDTKAKHQLWVQETGANENTKTQQLRLATQKQNHATVG